MTANRGGGVPRDSQCPARGPLLSHTSEKERPWICQHCGTRLELVSPAPTPPDPPLPPDPFDVAKRLRAMGLIPPTPEAEMHTEETLIEPKMTTGDGPQGSPYGRGRMGANGLSYRDRLRLNFYVHVVRDRTQDDRLDQPEVADDVASQ